MRSSGILRDLATRATWNRAASGEMSGSRPLPDVRVNGNASRGIFRLQLLHIGLDALDQGLVRGSKICSRRIGGIVGRIDVFAWVVWIGFRGRPPLKVLGTGEELPDRLRTNNIAVLDDQAAVGLIGK